jgi:hypothetical protein
MLFVSANVHVLDQIITGFHLKASVFLCSFMSFDAVNDSLCFLNVHAVDPCLFASNTV